MSLLPKDFDLDSASFPVRLWTLYRYTSIHVQVKWGIGLLSIGSRDLFYVGSYKISILFLEYIFKNG